MNLKEYKNKRSTMILEAENLIEANRVEEANAKMEEIANLDAKFEEEGKANANLNALRNKTIDDFVDFTGKGNTIIDSTIEKGKNVEDDALNTFDYRNAFMNYVIKGEKSNELTALNATGPSKSTDVGILIPTEISQKIIKKLENSGNILALVNRTNVPGGIEIPVEKLKPVATWVAEGAGSDKQKKDYGKVIFGYHKLRCAVSVTLEVANLTLASFESNLVENIADAMIKALEEAIINGDGSGKPKGILKEEANEGQALEVTAIELKTLLDAEAAIPEEYEETAEWCMSKKTFMQFIGITDSNGQLVARVDHGIDGKITRYLLGRRVHITKHVDSFSTTLGATKIFAFIFNFKDYTLNTAFNMGIRKYIDEETDDEVTKTAMLVDGKVTNKDSLVILKKR